MILVIDTLIYMKLDQMKSKGLKPHQPRLKGLKLMTATLNLGQLTLSASRRFIINKIVESQNGTHQSEWEVIKN